MQQNCICCLQGNHNLSCIEWALLSIRHFVEYTVNGNCKYFTCAGNIDTTKRRLSLYFDGENNVENFIHTTSLLALSQVSIQLNLYSKIYILHLYVMEWECSHLYKRNTFLYKIWIFHLKLLLTAHQNNSSNSLYFISTALVIEHLIRTIIILSNYNQTNLQNQLDRKIIAWKCLSQDDMSH